MSEGLAFRPDPKAAVGAFFRALLQVSAILVPLGIGRILALEDRGNDPWWVIAYENLGLGWAFMLALLPVARLMFTRYIIDEQGVRVHARLFTKTEHVVPWEKVTSLEHRRSVLDALLGLERLQIVAYGARGASLELVGLRRAAPLRDRAAAQMRRHCSVQAIQSGD